jgi:hypothetical protein
MTLPAHDLPLPLGQACSDGMKIWKRQEVTLSCRSSRFRYNGPCSRGRRSPTIQIPLPTVP